MSATPLTVGATIRGSEALAEVRRLIDQLYLIDSDIAEFDGWEKASDSSPLLNTPFHLTYGEVASVLQQRRAEVLRKLENKGIRVAPDPDLTHAIEPTRDATADPASA